MIDQFLNIELDKKGNRTKVCEQVTHRKTTLVILYTLYRRQHFHITDYICQVIFFVLFFVFLYR
jgi:hypothetical protein